jgi:hypothetical protein
MWIDASRGIWGNGGGLKKLTCNTVTTLGARKPSIDESSAVAKQRAQRHRPTVYHDAHDRDTGTGNGRHKIELVSGKLNGGAVVALALACDGVVAVVLRAHYHHRHSGNTRRGNSFRKTGGVGALHRCAPGHVQHRPHAHNASDAVQDRHRPNVRVLCVVALQVVAVGCRRARHQHRAWAVQGGGREGQNGLGILVETHAGRSSTTVQSDVLGRLW